MPTTTFDFLRPSYHVHLLGIGGAGMSAIAHVLLDLGQTVSGSDLSWSDTTQQLADRGATIFVGHRGSNVAGADLVVVTSAARPDNPEWQAAQSAGIPVWKRPEMLRQLLALKSAITIAGTHGKTTTTAMTAFVLERAGYAPAYIIGGVSPDLGGSARWGSGEYFVLEADEYDRTFLHFTPTVAVITNVEWDHVDCYPTAADFYAAFRAFAGQVTPDGLVALCLDDPGARRLFGELEPSRKRASGGAGLRPAGRPEARATVVSYALDNAEADWQATALSTIGAETHYTLQRPGEEIGRFTLRVPGAHNVRNALGTIIVADRVGIEAKEAAALLAEFQGTGRRFELKGEVNGVTVIDDYAHHPREIAATLAAAQARYPGRRRVVVFQSHTFSRTKTFLEEFAAALSAAEVVFVTDIYPSRETDTLGLHARDLVARITAPAHYSGSVEETAEELRQFVQRGDVVLVLGAGTSVRIGEWLVEGLARGGRPEAQASG